MDHNNGATSSKIRKRKRRGSTDSSTSRKRHYNSSDESDQGRHDPSDSKLAFKNILEHDKRFPKAVKEDLFKYISEHHSYIFNGPSRPRILKPRSSSQPTTISKRKRSFSTASLNALTDKEPDFGYEPPSAKRQQIAQSIYQSQPDSLVSSVHSLIDDLKNIDAEGNALNGSTTDSESNDETQHHDDDNTTIPDSPDSLENDDIDVSDDCHNSDANSDSEKSSNNVSDGNYSSNGSTEAIFDEISSELNSAYSAQIRCERKNHGERTPAHRLTREDEKKIIKEPKVKNFEDKNYSISNCMTPAAENDLPYHRQCPLPALSWANASDVWLRMCKKDEEAACLRDASMLERHPGLQPRMRAILLDWLIEVCEVYKLHRATYYLAVDYLDRYLTAKFRVPKTHLQLIGITCLFVAAKVEEIYPPKIGEFAYVTDGACQESDILNNEILLLQALDWDINPVTPMTWLGIYMQLDVNNTTPKTLTRRYTNKEYKRKIDKATNTEVDEAFIYPKFSGFKFVQTAQLLDLCTLDVGVAHFPYSVLAAAAISHTFNREIALRSSGLDWQTIESCVRWMEPFFTVINEEAEYSNVPEQNEPILNKYGLGHICNEIVTDDSYIVQTHAITMKMFDCVTQMQEHLLAGAKTIEPEASPATGLKCPEGLLTPPASSRKPLDSIEEVHTKTATKSLKTTTTTAVTTNTNSTAIETKTIIKGNNSNSGSEIAA